MNKIFDFKSRQPFYDKEKHGLKPNTTREIDLNDERFLELIHSMMEGFNEGDLKIKIINAENEKAFFIRSIEDISIYNNLVIISWKHEEGGEDE